MPEACNFIKKETLAKVFSCDFCEICKNTFFTEHLWTSASEFYQILGEVNSDKTLSKFWKNYTASEQQVFILKKVLRGFMDFNKKIIQ